MIFNINKRVTVMVMTLILALAEVLAGVPDVAWGNGNTTADAPAPAAQTKATTKKVKKATVKKAPVKTKKTKAPAKPAKAPVKKESSLEKGIALAEQERYQAALPWLQKAVQENPKSAAAWYWYGKCHEQTGQFYQAQYFYTRAVDIDPTFDKLSRVVVYPDDPSGKIPLWDPKRPARVYPVATQQQDGTYVVPPDAKDAVQQRLPSRPARDPELPSVPTYSPPQPGKIGEAGPDAPWQPAIYVPPSRISTIDEGDETAVYMPPEAPRVAKAINQVQPVQTPVQTDLSGFQNLLPASPLYQPQVLETSNTQLYQPPAPQESEKKVESAKKPAPAKKSKKPAKKSVKKPAPRKVVTKKTSTSKTTSTQQPTLDEPKLPVIPAPEPVQQAPVRQEPVKKSEPAPQPVKQEPVKQPEPAPVRQRSEEYLPPVGQGSSNKSNSASSIPPVSQ